LGLSPGVGLLIVREDCPMVFDYWLAGIVTAFLLIYLTYALLRPERF
jgi:K+-transporting ATPase ATPase F chain